MVPNYRALVSVPWTSCLRGEPLEPSVTLTPLKTPS